MDCAEDVRKNNLKYELIEPCCFLLQTGLFFSCNYRRRIFSPPTAPLSAATSRLLFGFSQAAAAVPMQTQGSTMDCPELKRNRREFSPVRMRREICTKYLLGAKPEEAHQRSAGILPNIQVPAEMLCIR